MVREILLQNEQLTSMTVTLQLNLVGDSGGRMIAARREW